MNTRQEEFRVPADELDAAVMRLLRDSGVRRVTIADPNGAPLLEIPRNAGTEAALGALSQAVTAISSIARYFTVTVQKAERPAAAPATSSVSNLGASEDQVDMRHTIGQRIDKKGTKVEDLAGVGEHDSQGG